MPLGPRLGEISLEEQCSLFVCVLFYLSEEDEHHVTFLCTFIDRNEEKKWKTSYCVSHQR